MVDRGAGRFSYHSSGLRSVVQEVRRRKIPYKKNMTSNKSRNNANKSRMDRNCYVLFHLSLIIDCIGHVII